MIPFHADEHDLPGLGGSIGGQGQAGESCRKRQRRQQPEVVAKHRSSFWIWRMKLWVRNFFRGGVLIGRARLLPSQLSRLGSSLALPSGSLALPNGSMATRKVSAEHGKENTHEDQ